jgi:hypothetical protein
MQHAQYNFVRWAALTALVWALNPAFAGTMAHPTPPDPLLDGGPAGPCAALAADADYAAGTDAAGHPVIPADVGAGPVPVPDSIAVPLAQASRHGRLRPSPAGEGAYVMLDGRRLRPLVNPPACGR